MKIRFLRFFTPLRPRAGVPRSEQNRVLFNMSVDKSAVIG